MFGSINPNSNYVSAYKCGNCQPELYWDYYEKDDLGAHANARCHKCGEACSVTTVYKKRVLTPADAARIKFEAWLKNEPEESRKAREVAQREAEAEERRREEQAQATKAEFEAIVAANWSPTEQAEISREEDRLKFAGNQYIYNDEKESE